jgi:hypothetical protein
MRTNRRSSLVSLLSLALLAGVGPLACSSSSNDAPGGGSSCAVDGTVACTDGTGYSCVSSDAPDDDDSSLICSHGVAGNAGSTLYCCLPAASNTSCGSDSTVSCPGGGFGFSCANASEPPNAAYPSLNCSQGTPGNAGSETYCCTD